MPCPLAFYSEPDKVGTVTYYPSYYLSRFNFILVHLFTVFYWFPFLFNNPLNFPLVNQLDASVVLPAGQCTEFDWENAKFDLFLFFVVWWLPHSGLSRRVVKQALGLWGHPLDRPLFGVLACLSISIWTHFWRPVSNCAATDFLKTPLWLLAASGAVIGFCLFLILGFFWTMPDHVFGTSRHLIKKDKAIHKIFVHFPYGMVRHPAATGFLWMFWALPSWTTNHIFYAACWSLFIVVGTTFEEGGLGGQDEFGKQYAVYKTQVGMFFPKLRWFLGKPVVLDQKAE